MTRILWLFAVLGIDAGPEVGVALRKIRELFQAGIHDREQLFQCLQDKHG